VLEVAFLELASGKPCVCVGRFFANPIPISFSDDLRPPMNEADVWRTAREMIQQYGAEAQLRARERAEKLLEFGIPEGCEDWTRVADAIAELDRKKPEAGEKLN
jgi:hypothetical protein